VEDWLLRLEGRFHDRIVADLKAYHQAMDELDQLRRQREIIRILHYKPLIYKEFWSAMQTTDDRTLMNAKQARKV